MEGAVDIFMSRLDWNDHFVTHTHTHTANDTDTIVKLAGSQFRVVGICTGNLQT